MTADRVVASVCQRLADGGSKSCRCSSERLSLASEVRQAIVFDEVHELPNNAFMPTLTTTASGNVDLTGPSRLSWDVLEVS